MNHDGLLLCARYSSAPNFFGYCGPDENDNLIDHLKEKVADKEVEVILSQFNTLFSYLKLISTENKIKDPFNQKVVEAYWIGNSLLDNIANRDYVYLLQEKLDLAKKMDNIKFQKVKTKVLTTKFYPHHSFHVFNIFKRTGNLAVDHTLETMDQCRISFGKVKAQNSKLKSLMVATKTLEINKNKLGLGESKLKQIKYDYKGKSFVNDLKIGDWVSFHWGFVCDVLTEQQVKNLEFYTQKAIDFYNL